jgi:Zn-finger nucleic acid-binding protein
MKCPTDGATLTLADRSGIEIDYCPQCRGVWLDRGELDKIIERTAVERPARTHAQQAYRPQPGYPPERRDYDDDDDWERSPGQRKRKRGMLGELFDFGPATS